MKKLIPLLLALMVVVSLFSGCGGSSASDASAAAASAATETETAVDAAPVEDESLADSAVETADTSTGALPDSYPLICDDGSMTLSVFQELNPMMAERVESYDELPFWQEIQSRTGIDLTWKMYSRSAVEEQFNLLVAASDLPDVVGTISYWYDGISAAVEQDVFVNLSDYIDDYAPDYKRIVEQDNVYPVVHDEDGNIIAFYEIGQKEFVPNNGVFLRGDMLEEQGLKAPVTYEEYEETLLALKAAYELEAPIYHYPDNYLWLSSGYGVKEDFSLNDAGEVIYGPIENGYRDYLITMNRWFAEGLIYKDFYTIPDDGSIRYMIEYMGTGKSFATFGYCEFAGMIELPEGGTFAAGYLPRQNANDQLHLTEGVDPLIATRGFALSTNCSEEQVQAACMLLNYFYTEEGAFFANYGLEGESFTYQEDGTPWYTDLILSNPDGLTMTEALISYIGYMVPCYADYTKYNIASLTTWVDFVDAWSTADNANTMPQVSLTAEEMETYSAAAADVETYMDEIVTKFIIGDSDPNDDAAWNDYIDTMNALGASDMLDIYRAAYERFKAV